ncbi:MAG: PHP domain-containing protein [Bacillota bacterium]|nr:PHP domain-containing protein [Bacillota bacterium]
MGKIDLHVHSYHSADGEFSPAELVDLAIESGVKVLAMADHNTVGGVPEFLEAGKEKGLEVIPAIEIDAFYAGKTFHIVGYYIDWQSEELEKLMAGTKQRQTEMVKGVVAELPAEGIDLTWEDVEKHLTGYAIPGFATVAKAIMAKEGFSGDQFAFMRKHLAPRVPPGYREQMPPASEIIPLIIKLGGIPVLAHPGSYLNPDVEEDVQTLKDLKEMGLKGIEAFSSYHTPELDEKFLQLGLELGLLITAGSDFHGEYKPKVAMGGIPETDYPIEENLEKAGFFLHRQKD